MNEKRLNEFADTAGDLLRARPVLMMGRWAHPGKVTCLDHSLFVAYLSYRVARRLHLDVDAATRGGLLHDLYLYNPRDKSAHPGIQCVDHPIAAERNARALTKLTEKERNIILSHMWPLGGALPRSREALVVSLMDKVCATLELSHICHPIRLRRFLGLEELSRQACSA